ncbi:minor capsid protein [Dorea formicigenerans]|uniref:minor capsid protein n=1 Tax=Dorea formicigenerans TaxID=39486 RepID=UPI0015F726FA|nr:minor capsid protein [Dorea formicigenerans]
MRTPQAVALIKAASNEALTDMGLQALQDVSEYVPHDFGTLENSGLTNSDKKAANGKFVMKWEEPYSQYLWNGKIMHGSPDTRSPADYYDDIKFTSDLARAEWAKYAREVYGEQWKQVYQAALKRRLK